MAIIDKGTNPYIGKKVRLNRDMETLGTVFLKGSVMTIIGETYRGWDVRDDDSGRCAYECGIDGHKQFDRLGW